MGTWPFSRENLTTYVMALQRFDETRQIVQQRQARKMDPPEFHVTLYQLAFLGADYAGMAEQQNGSWASPTGELGVLARIRRRGIRRTCEQSTRTEQASGGFRRTSGRQRKRAVDLANFALLQAAYGNAQEVHRSVADALKLAPASPGVAVGAALALAAVGDTSRAESLARDLAKRYPLGTQMQLLWLPTIQAQLALNVRNPARAVSALAVCIRDRVRARPVF